MSEDIIRINGQSEWRSGGDVASKNRIKYEKCAKVRRSAGTIDTSAHGAQDESDDDEGC